MEAYALHCWEQEFSSLNPGRNSSGHRVYSERDVELIRRIRELLYDERYTIAGARQRLEAEDGHETAPVRDGAAADPKPRDGAPRKSEAPAAPGPVSAEGRARIRAAGDRGGAAAIRLDDTLAAAQRIERTLDRLSTPGEPGGRHSR